MEEQIFEMIMGNLIGVVFGLLMYRMAAGSIKSNTEAVNKLSVMIAMLNERLK